MKWVTRENPRTDRIACPWLIRKFIDPDAEIVYVPRDDVLAYAQRESATSFDAPALVAADVGIAIGAGTDVAVEAGDVVLVRSDPRDVPRIIGLSRATYRKMVQNLVWATGYNLVAIPVAAGVLLPWGIDLPMAVGALAMSVSTIVVATNAQLLRRLELRRDRPTTEPALAPAA